MNYKELGFRCGIEIHNRLDTEHKLFCNCKPRFSNDAPIEHIHRKLRPVAGELGSIDTAVAFEYLKDKTFVYNCYSKENCLVDTDEEPPMRINEEALNVALQVALLLKADIPDEIFVMRKTVIDGSNTSAFQRTALIGINGILETTKGLVRITNINLEEESAGIVGHENNSTKYRLDRLGIPLVEIGTATDIKDPEHAKEVAEKLGMLIRSTGKSQRGIGVTRQDVNVSISKGARVEIKGFQDLDSIPKIIENEIKRQMSGNVKEETRLAKADGTTEFMRPLPGGERMYPETDIPPIITKDIVKKIKLPETWDKKLERFGRMLPGDLAEQVIKSEYLDLFEKFYKTDPTLVATVFTTIIKDMRRNGVKIENLNEKHFEELFKEKLPKEAIASAIEYISEHPDQNVRQALKNTGSEKMSIEELKKIISDIAKEYPDLFKDKKISAIMGEVMKRVKGRVEGRVVIEEIKKRF